MRGDGGASLAIIIAFKGQRVNNRIVKIARRCDGSGTFRLFNSEQRGGLFTMDFNTTTKSTYRPPRDEAHREQRRQYQRQYRKEHRDKVRQWNMNYYAKVLERARATKAAEGVNVDGD